MRVKSTPLLTGIKTCLLLLSSVLAVNIAPVRAAESNPVYEFNIKSQSLATALLDFSYQSDIQVVMPGALAEGLWSDGLSGTYTAQRALATLLKNTGLEPVFSSEKTITVRQKPVDPAIVARRRKRLEQLGMEQLFVRGEQPSEQIRDTTVARTALTGEDLESRGVKNANELQQFVPGLTVESPQASNTEFSIRGIGISNDDLSTQPGVAVFIDDIYIPRQGAANMAIYELDRVNVLRGPQSTVYARNATGGSIVYETRKPSPEFEARYLVEAGNHNHFNNLLTVNGEVTEGVASQLAIASFQRDPIMQNTEPYVGGNDVDSQAGRVAFRISPSENYEWLASFDRESRRQQAVLYSIGPEEPFQFAEGLPLVAAGDPPRSASVDTPGYEDMDVIGMMARLNFQGDNHIASYIFGRRSHEFGGLYDLDQTESLLVNKQLTEDSDTGSFEARWSSVPLKGNWTPGTLFWSAGALALEEKAEVAKIFIAPGLNAGENQWRQSLEEQSYAVYGQLQYQLSSRFRFSGGLRYIADFRHFTLRAQTSSPEADNPYLQESYFYKHNNDWRRLTPRLALNFDLTPESSFYAGASSGYKPGGHRGTPASLIAADREYRHERAVSYELGMRSNWFDNRMKFRGAVYSAEYSDMQVAGIDPVGNNYVQNAEKVTSKGFEVEIQARPVTSLKISMGLSCINARFDRFLYEREGQFIDKQGDRVPRVPDATFYMSALYLFPDTPLGSWSLRADATYSEEAENIDNEPAWPSYRAYSLWLDYLPHNGKWELTIWGRNLRNKEYFQASSPGVSNGEYAFARKLEPPRSSGISLKYFW